jgi:hypothetical protein
VKLGHRGIGVRGDDVKVLVMERSPESSPQGGKRHWLTVRTGDGVCMFAGQYSVSVGRGRTGMKSEIWLRSSLASPNTLLPGMKGTMSEMELLLFRQRSLESFKLKVRRAVGP